MEDSSTTDPLYEHEYQNETGTTPHQARSPQKYLSLGIHNTFLRRYAVLSAIQLLRRIRPSDGNIIFLSNKLCVKLGPFVQLSEASTLQFIAQHTSIPVPKVHCAFIHNNCTYILMDRIDGKMLLLDWRSRSAESKGCIQPRSLLRLPVLLSRRRVSFRKSIIIWKPTVTFRKGLIKLCKSYWQPHIKP